MPGVFNVRTSPHSYPYSRTCVRTKFGMSDTLHSLHYLRRWPDCHLISVGPLPSVLSCLFRKTARRTCGPLSWKPLERFCTLSTKTKTVYLQSFLNFSSVASRTLALALRFLPHPAGRAATRIGRIIIRHGPWSLPRSPEKKRMRVVLTFGMTRHDPLICAFNYPALALTLGKERWGELRELYLELSTSLVVKVRCTLAASLGELAKILGSRERA
jgi:hypothetical protein